MRLALYVAAALLLALIRWGILGVLLFSEPETADTVAEVLFGPARLGNDFPRLFLPAVGLAEFDLLRFLAGELLWLACSVGAAFVAELVWRARGR